MRIARLHTPFNYVNILLTASAIKSHGKLYLDMCSHLERIIRLLVGVYKITKGEYSSYKDLEISAPSFGKNLKTLASLPSFKELVAPIDSVIRNAKAHGKIIMKESQWMVVFNDRGTQSKELSFTDFVQLTRETASAMIVSAHVDSTVILPEVLLTYRLIKLFF